MVIKKTYVATLVVCGMLLGSLYVSIVSETPRIMVLHSYGKDYVWTNLIDQSLLSAFKQLKYNVKIRYFYMNTRNLDYPKNKQRVEQDFVTYVEAFDPQVIIAVDDSAQNIISKHYLNHPDIDVVFSGVNSSVEKYGYSGADNITGIFEHKPLTSLKLVIAELNRLQEIEAPVSVLFLADTSTSSHKNSDFLAAQDWGNIDYRGGEFVADYAQWQKFILENSGDYDYILVSGYRQLLDENGSRVDSEEVGAWTQVNSNAAVIGMNVFNSEDGILLSVGVSPYEQGAGALKLAVRIIRGDSPDEIPYRYPERYMLALSENAFLNPEVQQNYKKALFRLSASGL